MSLVMTLKFILIYFWMTMEMAKVEVPLVELTLNNYGTCCTCISSSFFRCNQGLVTPKKKSNRDHMDLGLGESRHVGRV